MAPVGFGVVRVLARKGEDIGWGVRDFALGLRKFQLFRLCESGKVRLHEIVGNARQSLGLPFGLPVFVNDKSADTFRKLPIFKKAADEAVLDIERLFQ